MTKYGAIYSGIDVRDYKMVCSAQQYDFPKEFDFETVRIKDQGSIGRCVATALSSIIEYYNYKQHGDDTEMSPGYIYGNRSNSKHKESGMIIRDALDVVSKFGDVFCHEFPYDVEAPEIIKYYNKEAERLYEVGRPHRISEYCRVSTVGAAKHALMSGTPLLMAMDWYEDMNVNKDGVLETNYEGYCGGHCMFIYGWNEYGWKVQNSWGTNWGIDGCFILPYEMGMAECWAVLDDIIDGTYVKKPFSSKIGKYLARFINVICNIFSQTTTHLS